MFVVERRGHFLFIETKAPDEPLTQGQEILLRELSRLPRWKVVVLFGEKGYPEALRLVKDGATGGAEETSREDFQRRVDGWYEAVMSL